VERAAVPYAKRENLKIVLKLLQTQLTSPETLQKPLEAMLETRRLSPAQPLPGPFRLYAGPNQRATYARKQILELGIGDMGLYGSFKIALSGFTMRAEGFFGMNRKR